MSVLNNYPGALNSITNGIYRLVGLGVTADTVIDFSDAPGGDLNLDDIFGDSSTPTTVVAEPSVTPSTPAATTSPEPVIKTKTGTVYKTVEDAVQGIEHKDALIAQLRDQVKKNTGVDPLVSRPQQTTQQPVDYSRNPSKYFEDIAKAVDDKNTQGYMDAQQKLIWDTLGPIAPTISALSKANAERVVMETLPEFKGFLHSEQFEQITQDAPLLADAIRSAEANPAAAAQLPELYRVAYLASQGRRVPELIQSVRNETPSVTPRPTVQSTQLTPPPTTGVPIVQPSLNTRDGRKALIDKMEQGGVQDLKW